MSESLFSTYWYRVANLKPMLRESVAIIRHIYRGQPWHVLHNRLNGRNHRFNSSAYALIGQMDGRRTVQQIWDGCDRLPGGVSPTQDELIRLLGRLHEADLVQSDILPSTMEMVQQFRGRQAQTWKQRAANPFSMRFPLFDPERLLERSKHLASAVFTPAVFVLWLAFVACSLVVAMLHWPDLSGRLSDQLATAHDIMLLWLAYPFVKMIHEFGHALAVKRWGGEVHEMGITLLALTPIPYVDATASAAFADKRQRIAVAGMGMMAELALAGVALFVWLNVEPGVVSALAYNAMLIAGVSTVVFNGNPLLRYDGYYILADLVEIPNLAQRSTRYLGFLLQRYALGIETAVSPVTAPGEKGWFIFYGPLAFCYRIAVLCGLVWMVSSRFFIFGIVLAVWGVFSLMLLPAFRTLRRFLDNPAVRQRRNRLVAYGAGLGLGIGLLVFVLPFPLWTTTQGVIWLPEQSTVRAGTDCEVVEIVAPADQIVAEDAPLIRGVDPFLAAEIEVFKSRLEELYAAYNAQPLNHRVKRKMLREEIDLVKGDLLHCQEKIEHLVLRSPVRGRFVLYDPHNLIGRFVRKGEVLGYIIADHRPTVRAVVSQADIGLVRKRVTSIGVRLAEAPDTVYPANIERIYPSPELELPSAALGVAGGGDILTDPTDPEGLRALTSYFQIDIRLPEAVEDPFIGGRIHVRLEHGSMALGLQWYRNLRQLLLRKFYV